MICRNHFLMVLMILCLGLTACSSPNSELIKSDSNQNPPVNAIVLMPVENKTQDTRVQKLLRARLLEELRFKGYPQIAAAINDGKSMPQSPLREEGKTDLTLLKNIQRTEGADAAMYCTLQESKSSRAFFYSPATVSVRCELRSTKTGETIWNAQHRSTSRSFDVMNSTLKSNGALESALEEVVGKVMETLPYGPMLRG